MNLAQFKSKLAARVVSQQAMIAKRKKDTTDPSLLNTLAVIEAGNQRLKDFLDNSDNYHVKHHGMSSMNQDVYTIEQKTGERIGIVTF